MGIVTPGTYVFRLFWESNEEIAHDGLCTQHTYLVEMTEAPAKRARVTYKDRVSVFY